MTNESCRESLDGVNLHAEVDGEGITLSKPEFEYKKQPPTLYKYYSMEGIEKTIFSNTFKWELSCNENDPFEALAIGWDKDSIKKKLPDMDAIDVALSDILFKSQNIQNAISHIVAYVSFSERANDILMWSHYAQMHTGACLEIDVAALGVIAANLSQVKYAEIGAERPRIPLGEDNDEEYQKRVRSFLSTKAKEWEYEKEWRSIIPPMTSCITLRKVGEGKFIFVSQIPSNAIKKVIFGYKMPVATRLALAKLVKVNHPLCTFAEINPHRTKFQLTVDDLGVDETSVNTVNLRPSSQSGCQI